MLGIQLRYKLACMEIGIATFLIVCPLAFLAGFVDAVAGGGGLISLPAFLIAGLPVHNAIATNKLASSMGTTVATISFARRGYIIWRQSAFFIPCALLGSALGANLALMIGSETFTILMLVILPVTAFYVLRAKPLDEPREPYPFGKTIAIGMAIAFGIGLYDGFYGPGTGTFLLLLLTAVAHLRLTNANGVTKTINLSTNLAALVVFIVNGKVIFALGLVAGLFNIAGNYIGAHRFESNGSKIVRPMMIVVLSIFFVRVIGELAGLW